MTDKSGKGTSEESSGGLKKALKAAKAGDYTLLNEELKSPYTRFELKESKVCEFIFDHPGEGFHAACSLMSENNSRIDEDMAELLVPVVCSKIVDKNQECWKAVRKFVESPKTREDALRVMANWMRNPEIVRNFFVSNALVDILWRLGTPEDYAEMVVVAENSAADGNPRAMARIGRMYLNGKGYEKDLDEAERWMSMASRQGVPWARTELKKIVAMNTEFKTARDDACNSTVRLFDLALNRSSDPKGISSLVHSLDYFADAGSVPALIRVIKAHHEGIGMEKDDVFADILVRRAICDGCVPTNPDDRMYLARMCCLNDDADTRAAVAGLVAEIDRGTNWKDLLEMALLLSYFDGDIVSKVKLLKVFETEPAWMTDLSALGKSHLVSGMVEVFLGTDFTYGDAIVKASDAKGTIISDCQALLDARMGHEDDVVLTSKVVASTLNGILDSSLESGVIADDDLKDVFSSLRVSKNGLEGVHDVLKVMMKAFDDICKSNGISYVISCGTLLGAYRHGGFVPWDDDVDYYMMRDDYERLKTVFDSDSPFKIISKLYLHAEEVVQCYHHVHLRMKGVNTFLDIMILDRVSSSDALGQKRYSDYSNGFRTKVNRLAAEDLEKGVDPLEDKRIKDVYRSYKNSFKSDMGGEGGTAVAMTMDNPGVGRKKKIFDYDDIFPTVDMKFEDLVLPGPHNPAKVLGNLYKEPMRFPSDLVRSHVRIKDIDVEKIVKFLEKKA